MITLTLTLSLKGEGVEKWDARNQTRPAPAKAGVPRAHLSKGDSCFRRNGLLFERIARSR